MKLNNGANHLLTIAYAQTRKVSVWTVKEVTWEKIVNKISKTTRTEETVQEYKLLGKPEQDEIKDVGGFVGGELKDGIRRKNNIISRSLVTLDADYASSGFWNDAKKAYNCAMICYSTHKHTPENPRLRLVIPLAKPVTPELYEAISRKIASKIGMDIFDDTTYEPSRLMYWPSTSKDGEYYFEVNDAPLLDPDTVIAEYEDWQDMSSWPISSRTTNVIRKIHEQAGDPLDKPGLIGAFCRTYDIHETIAEFLPNEYDKCSRGERYTYCGGSTSGGMITYDDKFAYSHHATDPACGILFNAFDLVRIHRFGNLDSNCDSNTPITKRPSHQSMLDLAKNDKKVKELLGKENGVNNPVWFNNLTLSRKGKIEPTRDNILTILKEDQKLHGLGRYNLFNDTCEVTEDLPWPRTGDQWTDTDEASLKHYLEKNYEIETASKVADVVMMAFQARKYHPIRDYLNNIKWDGIPRVETLFIDYLGSPDTEYTKVITRKTLVAAAKRAFEPGCKFDYMLTIVGKQGIGKSLIIKKLGMNWASDTLTDVRSKDSYEALDGVWLMEMGELVALKKSDREGIKMFISKQEDKYRKAYGRYVNSYKRQCIFIGTTNELEFLKDSTGNRRFWIIETGETKKTKTVWNDLSQDVVDQIWAEVFQMYKKGENIMELPDNIQKETVMVQETHSEQNNYIGVITEFLNKKIPPDFDNYEIDARKEFMSDSRVGSNYVSRTKLSAIEVWVECLQKDIASLSKATSRDINEAIEKIDGWEKDAGPRKYGKYGSQRGFNYRKP